MNVERKSPRRRAAAILAAAILAVVIGTGYVLLRNAGESRDVMPEPNGYNLIREAALEMGDRLEDVEDLPDSELAAHLEKHAAQLRLAREGMAMPCTVPVEFDLDWIRRHTQVMTGIRKVGHAFAVEAALYERQGDLLRAVQSAVDIIKLGHAVGNRGVTIDFMVDTACELQGLIVLTNLLPRLDSSHCRVVVQALEEIERERESLDAMFQREKQWIIRSSGLLDYWKLMIEHRSLAPERLFDSYQDALARLRQIRTHRIAIAARGFEVENARRPTEVGELVPNYLSEIPSDPLTHQPLGLSE